MIVTLDGPSGSGKSTVARAVARRSGLPHLDTGAFYRAAALAAIRAGVGMDQVADLVRLIEGLDLDQVGGRMLLDGKDVSQEIRETSVTAGSSRLAAHPEVRQLLVGHQRMWVERHGGDAVVEGRDIGTVVFPSADLKIYLDASPSVRASRRAIQSGEDQAAVIVAQSERDRQDSTRAASPLQAADDAIVIDTTDMSFEDVVGQILALMAGSG